MDGIINIYKEKGFTSHDVVAKLRGILKTRKIGHTGTLDPDAVGVLPVCIGRATKACDMLTDRSKVYEAVLHLGITTDTEDMTGKILSERSVTSTEEQIREAVGSFLGAYEQIPPMYSAIKVNGRKLYEIAREGKVIERKPRSVYIYELAVSDISLPLVRLRICCSKGTYIRSLCRDIGEKLGCGGCMEHLIRTRVGEFTLEAAYTLSQVEELVREEQIEDRIKPVDQLFSSCPKIQIDSIQEEKLLSNGNPISMSKIHLENTGLLENGQWIRMYDRSGRFIALYSYNTEKEKIMPLKMFFHD